MSRIKNLLILEHFTNNEFSESHTFGKYWFEFSNYGKILVIRQNDEWMTVSNTFWSPLKECLNPIRNDVIDELKMEIEKQTNQK